MAALGWLLNLDFAGGVAELTGVVTERFGVIGTEDSNLSVIGTDTKNYSIEGA